MFNDKKYTKWYYHIIKIARDRILDGYIAIRNASRKVNLLAKKMAGGV